MISYFNMPEVPFKAIRFGSNTPAPPTRLGKLVHLTSHSHLLPFSVAMRWIDLLAKPDWGDCWNLVFENIASHYDYTDKVTLPSGTSPRLRLSAAIVQSIKDLDEARCAKILGELYAELLELVPADS